MISKTPTSTQTFIASIALRGVNPFVLVGAARAAALKPGWRRPLPVLVRIDGRPEARPWRINLMPVGDGDFYLYLHEAVRRASQTKVGDRVRVELRFDATYRNGPLHRMSPAFRRALAAEPAARAAWAGLPPSRKKEVLRYLASLKSNAARDRNVARAVRALAGRQARSPRDDLGVWASIVARR